VLIIYFTFHRQFLVVYKALLNELHGRHEK
jgi:hypothetical protein